MGLTSAAREFHRYLPTGLGEHRCGVYGCNQPPSAEVHIAGLNAVVGGQLVTCPACGRNVPTDYTVRMFVKIDDNDPDKGSSRKRLCRDCAQDPEAGKRAARLEKEKRSKQDKLTALMNRLDRGEISEEQYAEELARLL